MGINKVVSSSIVSRIKLIFPIKKNSLGMSAAKYEKIINKPPTIIRKII